MINITISADGVESKGHATPLVCGEVSALLYFLGQTVWEFDSKSKIEEGPDGYTKITINPQNEWSVWFLGVFKRRVKEWGEKLWKGEVIVNDVTPDPMPDLPLVVDETQVRSYAH